MYDLAPILWSMDRRYYKTESREVQVEVQGQHTRGMTVSGWGKPNAEVSVDMLEDEVKALYLETIGVTGGS